MSNRVVNKIHINRTVEELQLELNATRDSMKRMMIENFIRIKERQDALNNLRMETESLDSLSEEDKYDFDSDDSEEFVEPVDNSKSRTVKKSNKNSNKNSTKKSESLEELEELEKIKKSSMRELKKKRIDKIREAAYREMIDGDSGENEESEDMDDEENLENIDHNSRWRSKDLNDPKYARYVKEDRLNNKMMERLNSEIDFLAEGRSMSTIVKPFDMGPGMLDRDMDDSSRSSRSPRSRRNNYRRR